MSEDRDPAVETIELQDDFIRHMEKGGRRIRILSIMAILVGAYFAANYFLQLVVIPYGFGIKTQTVNLVDPSLVAAGLVSLAVSLLWLYTGLRDLAFERGMAKKIRDVRDLQAQIAKQYGLDRKVAKTASTP
jgi:hypothetical protein